MRNSGFLHQPARKAPGQGREVAGLAGIEPGDLTLMRLRPAAGPIHEQEHDEGARRK